MHAGWFLEHAYLIPIIPAVAFWLILLFGKRMPDMKVGRFTIPGGGSLIGLASMVASLVLAVGTAFQWIQHFDESQHGTGEETVHSLARFGRMFLPSAEEGGEHAYTYVQPIIREWTWWQSGGVALRLRPAHRRPRRRDAAARRVHLDAGADLLARVPQGRSPLHALLRRPHAVLGRDARHGPRPEHGPADPRLGDHGPLLVHADRALVGGRGQQPCRAQGVLHRPRRRHRPAGRHGDPARCLRHARHRRHQQLGGRGRGRQAAPR